MESVMYYELNLNETITAERYNQQLEHLNDNLQKRSLPKGDFSLLLHDNARPHISCETNTDGTRMGDSPALSILRTWHQVIIIICYDRCNTL